LDNYIITNAGAEFAINKRLAIWTTNPNSKTYGDSDPAGLTTGSGSNFVAADNVTATYSRVAGENASGPTYHITATLSATPLAALDNYVITNTGAEFTINKRLATWTTNANSKTYGDGDPAGLTTGSGSNFVAADHVTASYSRVAGENASPPTYHITATLSATPLAALNNYIITNVGAEFTINKRSITVTADAKSKVYLASDPPLTYQITTGNLVFGDTISGALTRVAGELPGTYAIQQGTVTAGLNYNLTYVGANFTVTYGACSTGVGPGGVILQPINSDGTSVYQRKGGSTIPVKFTVCDAFGNPISNSTAVFASPSSGTITLLSEVRGTVTVVNEATTADIPDAAFRWTGNQWIFNMATTNLSQGSTYTFRINLAYGSISFRVGVK